MGLTTHKILKRIEITPFGVISLESSCERYDDNNDLITTQTHRDSYMKGVGGENKYYPSWIMDLIDDLILLPEVKSTFSGKVDSLCYTIDAISREVHGVPYRLIYDDGRCIDSKKGEPQLFSVNAELPDYVDSNGKAVVKHSHIKEVLATAALAKECDSKRAEYNTLECNKSDLLKTLSDPSSRDAIEEEWCPRIKTALAELQNAEGKLKQATELSGKTISDANVFRKQPTPLT